MINIHKEIRIHKAHTAELMRQAEQDRLARQHASQNNAQADQKSVLQTLRTALKLRQA